MITIKYKTWYIAMSGDRKKATACKTRAQAMAMLAEMMGVKND